MKARPRLVKVRLKPPVVEVVMPPRPLVVVEEGVRLRLGETEAGERPAGAEMGAETKAPKSALLEAAPRPPGPRTTTRPRRRGAGRKIAQAPVARFGQKI